MFDKHVLGPISARTQLKCHFWLFWYVKRGTKTAAQSITQDSFLPHHVLLAADLQVLQCPEDVFSVPHQDTV